MFKAHYKCQVIYYIIIIYLSVCVCVYEFVCVCVYVSVCVFMHAQMNLNVHEDVCARALRCVIIISMHKPINAYFHACGKVCVWIQCFQIHVTSINMKDQDSSQSLCNYS